jgi:hypothetical protein
MRIVREIRPDDNKILLDMAAKGLRTCFLQRGRRVWTPCRMDCRYPMDCLYYEQKFIPGGFAIPKHRVMIFCTPICFQFAISQQQQPAAQNSLKSLVMDGNNIAAIVYNTDFNSRSGVSSNVLDFVWKGKMRFTETRKALYMR